MKKPEKQRSSEYDKFLPKVKRSHLLNEAQETELKVLRKNGATFQELAEKFNISKSCAQNYASNDPLIWEKVRVNNKKWYDENFVPGVRKLTKEQKKRKRLTDIEFRKTLRGFFIGLYNSKISSLRKKEKLQEIHKDVPMITIEDLLWLWGEHVRTYGVNCYYTGIPLTFYDPDNLRAPTLCTIDRFDSEKGYTVENIVFCSWEFNNRKGSVSVADCKLILQKHEKRNQ